MTRTASELAEYLGAKLAGDGRARISGIASPERAQAEDLIYADSISQSQRAAASAAICVVGPQGLRLEGKTILEAGDPKFAFAKAAAWILPRGEVKSGAHSSAVIASSAKIGARVSIGAYVVIGEDVSIGDGAIIEAFCCLGHGSRVGNDSWLHPRVTLYPGAKLGDRVEVHAGAVIGGDGFGYVFGEGKFWKFPQVGGMEIADDVVIGSNSTIDRGSLDVTRIAAGVKIDNLVQIAHNVKIGEHSIIAAQTGISGSSVVGKRVMMGGQVGIAERCTIEDTAIVGAQAGVPTGKTIRQGQTVWGTPARVLARFKQQFAWVSRLPELAERIKKLEKELRNPEEQEK